MKKIFFLIIIFEAFVQCFAQTDKSTTFNDGSVLNMPDTVVGDMNFRRYSFTFECSEFSKTVNLCLPLPEGDAVMEKIRTDLLSEEYSSAAIEQEMIDEINIYTALYKSNKDTVTETYTEVNLEEDSEYEEYYMDYEYVETAWSIVPVFVGGGYVAFSSFFMEYFGGAAHPMWGEISLVYSLSTGEQVKQDDILDNVGAHRYLVARKLFSLLKEYLDEDDNADDVDVMMMLNDNFYFTDKELIYRYVPYEVSYYAAGEPTLSLPKKWLKPYLNVDGPLYKYWFGSNRNNN